jgi:uncharacterized protein (TIGR01777 family)
MRVFVTGATGLIGRRLVGRLIGRGDDVVALTRSADRARGVLHSSARIVEGDPTRAGDWQAEVSACEGVVHLAGEPVLSHRWNAEQKALLTKSRVDSTRNLVEAAGRAGSKVRALVAGSAIGYYGFTGDREIDEKSPPGTDFLAELCVAWEREASYAASIGARRVVLLRTGVVLDPDGGALKRMLAPFKAFIGGPIGSGKQWLSWIHRDDLTGLIELGLDDARATGAINGVAPPPATMKELSAAVGRALGRPSWLPVPTFAAKIAFGESAGMFLESQRVLPRRALELGYAFKFPTLDGALRDLLSAH